ncbi:hypothetical protein [Rhizobium sp. SYY.PMSO]|uniref:hypothetical protein n=1 Tax=Rhizobium sp. SYY.PMSO TaxID=3382192 RepID=UPI00398FBF7C
MTKISSVEEDMKLIERWQKKFADLRKDADILDLEYIDEIVDVPIRDEAVRLPYEDLSPRPSYENAVSLS